MIANEKELLERALVKETRTLQRQKLLKQLWRLTQRARGGICESTDRKAKAPNGANGH